MYPFPHEESTEHIENICILPTRAHVAVAYQPSDAQAQAIRIYSFKGEEEPITLKIFHENEKAGQVKLLYFSPSEPKFMVLFAPFSAQCLVSHTPNCSSWTPLRTRL